MKRTLRKACLWLAVAAGVAASVMPVSAQKLFSENFDSLPLGPNPEEASKGVAVWTRTPPTGWTVDDSLMPGYGTPDYAANDGRTEWSGWAFADVKWWPTVDDQRRSTFTLASGVAAIADPDEWDDATHLKGLFNSYLITKEIDVSSAAAGTLALAFDSSWRPEGHDDGAPNWPVDGDGLPINNQTALISALWDNGAPVEILHWDSVSDSPFYKADVNPPNESVMVALANPAGAKKLVLKIGLLEAANDWWWAFDNLAVGTPPMLTGISANGVSFTVRITEGLGMTVDESKGVTVQLDGTAVSPVTIAREGDAGERVLVTYSQAPAIFPPKSVHNVAVQFTTGDGRTVNETASFVAPSYTAVAATPTTVTATITDTEWLQADATKPIALELDGVAVAAQSVARQDTQVLVRYAQSTPFASGSAHALKVTFTTVSAQQVTDSVGFSAPTFVTLAPGLATDLSTGADAGMKWRTHQVASRDNTIAATEKQLAGELGESLHDPTLEVAGGYFEIPYVNFDQNAGDAGHFNASAADDLMVYDDYFPGIPGTTGSNDYIAGESLAYVAIPQTGVYTMVVNSDDGFQVSVGNASTPTYQILGLFDAGRSAADTAFYFNVEKPGIYLFRLLYFEGTGDARIEWFTQKADGSLALLNGTQAGALKAYRTRTVAEPPLPSAVDFSIGLNFGADEYSGGNQGTLAAADKAGAPDVAQANWNNLKLLSGSSTTIVADVQGTATPTSAAVSWTSANTWASTGRGEENNALPGADKTLMLGYLDTGAATTSTVTIQGLPEALTSEGYDVYVYLLGGVAAKGGGYRIVDVTTGAVLKDYVQAQCAVNPTAHVQAIPNGATPGTGTYVLFSGVASPSIRVEATTENGHGFGTNPRAPINAVQLVAPATSIASPVITRIARLADGTITIEWAGGGTLQAAASLSGPWQDVSASSPYTFTPQAGVPYMYGRIWK